MMETEASPTPSPSSSSNYPFQGDFSSFGDLFSQSQNTNTSEQPLPNPNTTLSPGQNFADLLAEFTLPGNALSPQTLESLVGNAGTGSRGAHGEELGGSENQNEGEGGGPSNAPSPQHHQPQHPINQADVNLQFQQFIAASLANGSGGIPTPTPHQYTPQQHYHSQNPSLHSSPSGSGIQSLPNSHAPSPLPSYSNAPPSNPIFLPQQHFSQPPMHQSPYVMVPNPYSVGPEQYSIPSQTAAVFAHQFAMLQSQGQQQMANVLAQAQAIVQANQVAQAQHIQQQQQQQQQSIGSQSTSADSEWRDNEFMFSPLMSPAMTPGSAYTPASSLPPSVGPLPLAAPSDFFPPLTSPALGPHVYSSDQQHHHNLAHRNSLQGLVDGVGALSTQLPPGSPLTFPYQSPQMRAIDAGHHTAAGSGRRGASSTNKKTRPSPLIKASDPALDPNRRKRKMTGPNSNGSTKSASNSPYISATNPKTGSTPGAFSAGSSSNGGGLSQKTSPIEFNTGIDTPSPVDLTSSTFSIKNGVGLDGLPIPPPTFASSSRDQPYQLEPMGPPPPPHHSHQLSSQPLSTSASSSGSFNPITPATIMNFSSDFDLSTLSSLSPALGPTSDGAPGSAFSGSLQNSPILLPQPDSGEAATASSAGKARSTRKSGSVKASPALRAVDAKGKGKAAEGVNGKKAAKQTKIAPSPKISGSSKIRPLLAADAAPEAQTRLASKNNHENVADGRGNDLSGLNASTPSAIQPAVSNANGGTAESRKSTHKLAEQKRRDSLKLCFDELRSLLPPILPSTDDANRRPGEGNVGGQRNGEVDPENPNKGVSKVALLRRSNEYLEILKERIERRDQAIWALRKQNQMLKGRRSELGSTPDENDEDGEESEEDEIPGLDLDLDNIDGGERRAGNLAFYEDLDFESKIASLPIARRGSTSSSRRTSVTSTSTSKPTTRRSTRNTVQPNMNEDMDVEG